VSDPSPALARDRAATIGASIDWATVAGLTAIAGLVGAGLLIAAGSASHASFLVPASRRSFPDWLRGPLGSLHVVITFSEFATLMVLMVLCYLVLLAVSRSLSAPAIIAAILALHAIFALAPPLLSADSFGYIGLGRLGALHGLSPYSHGASAVPSDPVSTYVGWQRSTSPYGPLFTLAGYGLAPLSVPVALWLLKAVAAAASLGCVVLVSSLARRLGRSPLQAAIFFGLNPIVLVWAVGGAHNDLLLMLVVLAGAMAVTAARPGAGLASLVVACGIKLGAALTFPFAFLDTRGTRRLVPALIALCAVAAVTLAGFWGQPLGFLRELSTEQRIVAVHSVPNELGLLVGLGGITKGLRIAAAVALVCAVAVLLLRTARGGDWLTNAGWATLWLLVCSAWLLPWYTVWVLPFAAAGNSGRLRVATLLFTTYVIAARVTPGFG
jgi:hypothetical protein